MKKKLLQVLQVLAVSLLAYYVIFLSAFTSLADVQSVLPFFGLLFGLKVLTLIFIISLYVLLLALTNRNWLSTSILMLLSIIFAFVNHVKLTLRNEPFLPSDLSMVKSLSQLIHMVTVKEIALIIIGVLVIVGLSLLIFRKKHKRFFQKKLPRLIALICALLLSTGFISISHTKSPIHKLSVAWHNDPLYWDPVWGVKRNGPVLNFINYLNTNTMTKPSGYSQKTMAALAKKYTKKATATNKTRQSSADTDVVMILSESFSDPTKVPGIKLNMDPMPYTRNLMSKTPSGTMLSNGYGGGTANMEFQALTSLAMGNFSLSLITPYTQLVPKMQSPFTVNNLSNQSIAIHPYDGNLYNRHIVLKKFGFSKFYTQDGPDYFPYKTTQQNNPYVTDAAVYKDVVNQIKTNQTDTFYHVITMQNHMPYLSKYYPGNNFKVSGAISQKEKEQVETFANGVNLTDKANETLISQLKKLKKNVVVIFYGDHLPGIYDHANFSKDGILMHETPYFIWSNHTKLKKSAAEKLVGPYGFANTAYNAANFKITPYYALLNEVTEKLPIITTNMLSKDNPNTVRTGIQLVSQKTNQLVSKKSLSAKQKQILHDYQLVQYDLTSGQHYLNTHFMK